MYLLSARRNFVVCPDEPLLKLDFPRVKIGCWTFLDGTIIYIHFPVGSQLEHRAPFGVSVITHTLVVHETTPGTATNSSGRR
jgi:hypothetical protein